ncbi:hypothetical protein [Nocardioides sp.]|uniref:hypothetical protein n=1 Tax=Nocardioides sp. TaxID=35761 RepID=UPI002623A130|nr:hypothetical protein [Nocardioides sp.]MDI6910818.1 hypothetical protein [Nocardioides sp.]
MTLILRAIASAALVVGLLTTAPAVPDAHGATAARETKHRTARKATVRKDDERGRHDPFDTLAEDRVDDEEAAPGVLD